VADRGEFGEADWALIEHLANQRLLLTTLDQFGSLAVQVVHEALLGKWERLNKWIEDNRKYLMAEAECRDAARRWMENERDISRLLRGRALSEAVLWIQEKPGETEPLIVDFIAESLMDEIRRAGTASMVQKLADISETSNDLRLKLDSLGAAVMFHLRRWEPLRAYSYYRRLGQYERSVMLEPKAGAVRAAWRRELSKIWRIRRRMLPVVFIWLLSWFGISFIVNDAINYRHYYEVIGMCVASVGILIVLRFARYAFVHPLLCLPPVLLLAEISAIIARFGDWSGYPSNNGVASLTYGSIWFLLLSGYLILRHRSNAEAGVAPDPDRQSSRH
jgi:hypothetical protein